MAMFSSHHVQVSELGAFVIRAVVQCTLISLLDTKVIVGVSLLWVVLRITTQVSVGVVVSNSNRLSEMQCGTKEGLD
jgi:hypothetical protein